MLIQELVLVTNDVAKDLYVAYKTSKELALGEISKLQLENIELHFRDKVETNPTYKKCLYHESEPRKLLIIEGHSGSGKKTWCRKLLKTWCTSCERRQRSGNDTNQEEQNKVTDDIKTLGLFPLLFFVSLRDVGTAQTPTDIIQQQCLKNQHSSNDLELLITHRHEEIILLIHGVDEAKRDVDILKAFLNMNCVTIITCDDCKVIQNNIQPEKCETMASIHFNQINSEMVVKYAKHVLFDLHYPENAYKVFMELVKCKDLNLLMKEAFFVQPIIYIWHQYNTLPSDIAGVCLCFIQENLKKCRQTLKSYGDLNMDMKEIVSSIPRVQGMVFIINHGKVLKGLGKTAYHCLENKESKNRFSEELLLTNSNITDKKLTEICISAKLISASLGGQKRLRFCHPMIQNFMVAFYLACEPNLEGKDTNFKDNQIQKLLHDLRKTSIFS